MSKYIYYLINTLKRKKGIWITLIIGILIFATMLISQIKSDNNNNDGISGGSSYIDQLTTFDFFFPFIFSALFLAFVIVHCFKEGEDDGSELLVIAKPLNRKEIILGKFITIFISIIVYQLIYLVIYSIISFFDSYADGASQIKFIFSMTLGGLIIQLFIAGIITIFASFVGKVGTIVISILFAAAIPILSFSIAPILKSSAYAVERKYDYDLNIINNYDNQNGQVNYEKIEDVVYDSQGIDTWQKAIDDDNYQYAAFFDIWYQWGRFYTLFNRPQGISVGVLKNASLEKINDFANAQSIEATVNGQLKNIMPIINADNNTSTIIPDFANKVNQFTQFVSNNLTMRLKEIKTAFPDLSDFDTNTLMPLYIEIANNISASTPTLDAFEIDSNWMYNDQDVYILKTKDYISTPIIVIIWSILGLALFGVSGYIYAKRDFK